MDDKQLSLRVSEAIASPENEVYVSAVSIWEMMIKKQLNKLACPNDLIQVIYQSDFLERPISFQHKEKISSNP